MKRWNKHEPKENRRCRVMGRKPICLQCKHLVWDGFLEQCAHVLEGVSEGVFEEAFELAEVKSEKERIVIEQQQDIRFEESLADKLMTIPYMTYMHRCGRAKINTTFSLLFIKHLSIFFQF